MFQAIHSHHLDLYIHGVMVEAEVLIQDGAVGRKFFLIAEGLSRGAKGHIFIVYPKKELLKINSGKIEGWEDILRYLENKGACIIPRENTTNNFTIPRKTPKKRPIHMERPRSLRKEIISSIPRYRQSYLRENFDVPGQNRVRENESCEGYILPRRVSPKEK